MELRAAYRDDNQKCLRKTRKIATEFLATPEGMPYGKKDTEPTEIKNESTDFARPHALLRKAKQWGADGRRTGKKEFVLHLE